ncbi:putative sarcosine oxidase [Holothuria leucospilota]|uniref:Sarcosine oxidase n=1 Tax=Holothuria leucospilota TaxID=206669 RepID=A0A9Q1H0M1_HOLLE|nr:putative sarcosine oxidase [Holothuria leucospilota]
MDRSFDVCVIGAGLWGSAAARHLSQNPGMKVCLIGPEEPKKEDYPNAEVLGSHYDEGRITRETDGDSIWAVLAQRSIERYHHLEKITGVTFYSEVGCMTTGPKGSHYLSAIEENCKKLNIDFLNCSQYDLRSLFPYLKSSPSNGYLFTRKRSGYISPRKLITAQKTAAHLQGCEIINDTVTVVSRTSEGGQRSVCITTKNGGEVYTNRILLCTGAFTNFHGLLEEELKLDVTVESEMVVKPEVSGKELAKLKDMPVMISFTGVLPDVEDFYLLPPIQYPNGKFYLKLGHHKSFKKKFSTLKEVKDWFIQGGDEEIGEYLLHLIHHFIEDFEETSVECDAAVTTGTPSGYPYCGMVTPNIGVLVGGNGYGAKSSDEIGRMGAMMIKNGRWNHDLPEEKFKPRFKRNSARTSKL